MFRTKLLPRIASRPADWTKLNKYELVNGSEQAKLPVQINQDPALLTAMAKAYTDQMEYLPRGLPAIVV